MTQSGDYFIKIDFQRGVSTATKVFTSHINLISAFQRIDNHLLNSLSLKVTSDIVLWDIQPGSMITWLINSIEKIDDEALKKVDWRVIVGNFLFSSKYRLINYLKKRDKSLEKRELEKLKRQLEKLASRYNPLPIPGHSPIEYEVLLSSLSDINESVSDLSKYESISIGDNSKTLKITHNPSFTKESIEVILGERVITKEITMTLRVKKPDFLGTSMWDFRYGGNHISAKIEDKKWLSDFHTKKVKILPGDSIEAQVEVTTYLDEENRSVAPPRYRITKVINEIPSTTNSFNFPNLFSTS